MADARRWGVLLLNLGTPDSPQVRDVRRYLREFLSDPRVIDLPAPLRWALLHLVILPFRPRRSAAAYASIWSAQGSPLLVHSRSLEQALAKELGDGFAVELGMRYGNPSIPDALARLEALGADRVLVIPLFPQYASSSTGSALARVLEWLASRTNVAAVVTLEPFYHEPGFVQSWVEVARPVLAGFEPEHVLMSFHGLPERQIRASDRSGAHCLTRDDCCAAAVAANAFCYRAQCFATGRSLAAALALPDAGYSVAFQSRLGRAAWIRPYTDHLLPELAQRGVRRLAVLCPSFVADCLETVEEIGIRAREQWRDLGGSDFALVPCLNAHPAWVRTLGSWIRDRTQQT